MRLRLPAPTSKKIGSGSGAALKVAAPVAPAPQHWGKENIILELLKTDYELSKLRSNTCTSTCRSYSMFTLEKTCSVPCNFYESLNKYLRWSQSQAKVTALAPAKYPGSGRLRNPAGIQRCSASLFWVCFASYCSNSKICRL